MRITGDDMVEREQITPHDADVISSNADDGANVGQEQTFSFQSMELALEVCNIESLVRAIAHSGDQWIITKRLKSKERASLLPFRNLARTGAQTREQPRSSLPVFVAAYF